MNKQQGFTLIEMLVVVAIVIIMTGVALANFPGFRDKTSLDLVAQEVAITIRQAQVYGIGTKAAANSSFPSHGIYFDNSTAQAGRGFVLFADSNSINKVYNAGSGCSVLSTDPSATECREDFRFRKGVKIVSIEACPPGLAANESSCQASQLPGQKLNIAFVRPDAEATFGDDTAVLATQPSHIKIVIAKTTDPTTDPTKRRKIVVWNTGHIYVEQQ